MIYIETIPNHLLIVMRITIIVKPKGFSLRFKEFHFFMIS